MKTSKRNTSWNIFDKTLSNRRAKFILPYLNVDKVVCDVGCGQEGKVLVDVAPFVKEGYGFDFNLKVDNKNPKPNIFLSNDDFLKCEKKFDVIFLLAVIEHLDFPDLAEKMVSFIFERLNDGGTFILTTPSIYNKPVLEFLAYKLKIINEEEIRDHKHYFTKDELISLLKNIGFKDVQHKYFQFGLNNLVVCKK